MMLIGMFWQSALAQSTRRDSLQRIMFDRSTKPEQRKNARDEILGLGAFAPLPVEHSQDSFLRESALWFKEAAIKQDLLVEKLIDLIRSDTLIENGQKLRAIQLLVKSGTPKAYAFLIKNMDLNISALGPEDTNDIFWKATYRYISQEATGNWALFPLIMSHLSVKIVRSEDTIPLAIILEQIVGTPSFLIALLNLYEMKEENEIFTENKKTIVQALDDIH